jgi:hypothetical protein
MWPPQGAVREKRQVESEREKGREREREDLLTIKK